jgi:hypothetical protein
MVCGRGLQVRGYAFVVVIVVVRVVQVIVVVRCCRPEEVPVKVRGLVVSRGFVDACSVVGMGEAHPLEEQGRDQE